MSSKPPKKSFKKNSESSPKDAKLDAVVKEIAEKLGETEKQPIIQIKRILQTVGEDATRQLLKKTFEIEAQGGMTTLDGTRRRTVGGVFFYLFRQEFPNDVVVKIFYPWIAKLQEHAKKQDRFPKFLWQKRKAIFESLNGHKGRARKVRINLIGRPGKVEYRQNLVIVSVQDELNYKNMSTPADMPSVENIAKTYYVMVSSRQWERVQKIVEGGKDELIVEGLCGYDEEVGGIVVYATYVSTHKLQRKLRKQRKNRKPETEKFLPADPDLYNDDVPNQVVSKPKKAEKAKKKQNAQSPAKPAPVSIDLEDLDISIPEGMPEEAVKKLRELYAAAETFRQKIANIQSKPTEQQFGLDMTLKLLLNVEKQIAALKEQYSK